MKKFLITIFTLTLFTIFTINYLSAPVVCLGVKLYSLEKIANNILVTPSVSNDKKEKLIKLFYNSKERINNVFGEVKSSPLIIYFDHSDFFLPFKINMFGQTPTIGNSSCVIVGPYGQNIDVVSHELMHAEIHYRIGAWKMFTEIPAWFDEGLAMQVDYRERFNLSTDQSKVDSSFVRKLGSYNKFHQTKDSYPFAKKEVQKIVSSIGERNIFDKLDSIQNKDSFEETFLNSK